MKNWGDMASMFELKYPSRSAGRWWVLFPSLFPQTNQRDICCEKLDQFCSFCGFIGHDNKSCHHLEKLNYKIEDENTLQ